MCLTIYSYSVLSTGTCDSPRWILPPSLHRLCHGTQFTVLFIDPGTVYYDFLTTLCAPWGKEPQIIHFYLHYLSQCSINVEWMNDSLAPGDFVSDIAVRRYGLPLISCRVMTRSPLQTEESVGTSFTLPILPDCLRNLSLQCLLILFLLFLLYILYTSSWLQLLT